MAGRSGAENMPGEGGRGGLVKVWEVLGEGVDDGLVMLLDTAVGTYYIERSRIRVVGSGIDDCPALITVKRLRPCHFGYHTAREAGWASGYELWRLDPS